MLIQKYTSDWVQDFLDLKLEIGKALSGIPYEIEHVGSTSVPGLESKPIIDIIYNTALEFEKIKSGLIKTGYYHNGNQGIPEREVFKRRGRGTSRILDSITNHLYVCPIKSKALERHLLFRDFLRKNESARLEYEALKYRLAEEAGQNKKVYAELKELKANAFIDTSIEKENSR